MHYYIICLLTLMIAILDKLLKLHAESAYYVQQTSGGV